MLRRRVLRCRSAAAATAGEGGAGSKAVWDAGTLPQLGCSGVQSVVCCHTACKSSALAQEDDAEGQQVVATKECNVAVGAKYCESLMFSCEVPACLGLRLEGLAPQSDAVHVHELCAVVRLARPGVRLQVQNRYQVHNPDAARPARRIYVGGLPPDTVDVRAGTGVSLCLAVTGKLQVAVPLLQQFAHEQSLGIWQVLIEKC